ncbi:hypothetical protein LguiB_021128 [Lonicera macranthoides]
MFGFSGDCLDLHGEIGRAQQLVQQNRSRSQRFGGESEGQIWRYFMVLNELCGGGVSARIEAEQYGKDMITLKTLVKELYVNSNSQPKVLGLAGFNDEKWFNTFPSVTLLRHRLMGSNVLSVFAPLIPLMGHRAVLGLSGYVLKNVAFLLQYIFTRLPGTGERDAGFWGEALHMNNDGHGSKRLRMEAYGNPTKRERAEGSGGGCVDQLLRTRDKSCLLVDYPVGMHRDTAIQLLILSLRCTKDHQYHPMGVGTLVRSLGFSRQTKYLQGSHGARARLLARGIKHVELWV